MRLRLVSRIKGAAATATADGRLVNFCARKLPNFRLRKQKTHTANDGKRINLLFDLKDTNWCALTYRLPVPTYLPTRRCQLLLPGAFY